MVASTARSLCQTCRNLNLRIDTFIDTGWRYPTSLQYETVLDVIGDTSEADGGHYVPGEQLIENVDYTAAQLAAKLKAPTFVPEFDEDDGLLLNDRPSKRQILGQLVLIKQKASRCTLCRFILQQVEREEARQKKSLQEPAATAFNDTDKCKIKFEYDGQGCGNLTRELMQRDETLQYGRYECIVSVGRSFEFNLYPLLKDRSLKWFGSRTYGPKIDFRLARSWLHSCEGQHPRCGSQSWHSRIKPISKLRLIDVQNMCLVDEQRESRYVALSYVWGAVPMFKTEKRFLETLFAKNGLVPFMDEISTTIQDAMLVVRELGERFLWTDAICIVQDDWDDKKRLIGSMDTVYAHAILTIVAAEGTNASAGLPGVNSNLRSVPAAFEYSQDLALFPGAPPLSKLLLDCPWSTRAWTYQEGLLSIRMLVFSDKAVHFACNSTCWSEDLYNPSETCPPPWEYAAGIIFNLRSTLTDIEWFPRPIKEDILIDDLLDLWESVVQELSSRNLSYETDILYAGAGVFNLLEQFFNTKSLYGLPECRIEDSLFWSPMYPGQLRRRLDLDRKPFNPSWSWCGWVGEVTWMGGATEKADFPGQEPIDWMKVESSGNLPPVSLQRNGRDTLHDSISSQTMGHPSASQQFLDSQWPLLQFRTRMSQFHISKVAIAPDWVAELQPYAWYHVPPETKKREGVYCITTCDDVKNAVGSVVLDTLENMAGVDELAVKFVVLSSAPQTVDVGDFAGQVFYNVLAIEMKGDVAERIGHGRILQNFWDESGWEWKLVVLG